QELVYRRPLLCLHEAMSHAWFGQLDEANEFLAQADKHLRARSQEPRIRFMLGYADYIKSRVTAMRGDVRQAIQLGLAARENIPASNQALQGGIGVMLGYGYFLDGDFAHAIQTLTATIQSGITAAAINTTIGAYCVLARLYAIQGQLHRAHAHYQEASAFLKAVGGQHLGAMSVVDVGIAEVMVEWNALDAALRHIKQGLENIQFWSKADDIALAYTIYSRIQQAQGRSTAAMETIDKGAQLIRSSGVFSEARDAVSTTQVRLWLIQGHSLAVEQWADALAQRLGEPLRFENELTYITLARVYLAQGTLEPAIQLLSELEAHAQAGGRTGRLLGIMILKAFALQMLGDPEAALALLATCLTLAEPEGYARSFLDEGQPMQLMLAQWLAHAEPGPIRDYANRLLAEFGHASPVIEAAPAKTSPNERLIEPLSQRELEVLHIMALGKTNQQIAEQLVVARGTIKAHTASIYRKLDVANRTEAIARARQLGILP
ncbi:MAG: tetratricopeptide repeat protein, partial [Anaerolineae bacterium]|nr:tetratricopeptide repeat protein [Anaerolineae bacterium]